MYCKNCLKKGTMQKGVCDECGYSGYEKKTQPRSSSCEICGNIGVEISAIDGKVKKVTYRCFDCHEKETVGKSYDDLMQKGIDFKKSWERLAKDRPKYYAYLSALRENYRKPLFYGREPNMCLIKMLEKEYIEEDIARLNK